MPQYLSELITWTAIGARTTESQTHREMASGLSTPVGFKNGTDGTLGVAINALQSVRHPHHFLGISQQGQSAVFRTRGNALRAHRAARRRRAHQLRFGQRRAVRAGAARRRDCPPTSSSTAATAIRTRIPALQPLVAENCANQILEGNRSIVGLHAREQSALRATSRFPTDLSQLRYGVSVTDACIDWATTERLLLTLHTRLSACPRTIPALRHSQPA